MKPPRFVSSGNAVGLRFVLVSAFRAALPLGCAAFFALAPAAPAEELEIPADLDEDTARLYRMAFGDEEEEESGERRAESGELDAEGTDPEEEESGERRAESGELDAEGTDPEEEESGERRAEGGERKAEGTDPKEEINPVLEKSLETIAENIGIGNHSNACAKIREILPLADGKAYALNIAIRLAAEFFDANDWTNALPYLQLLNELAIPDEHGISWQPSKIALGEALIRTGRKDEGAALLRRIISGSPWRINVYLPLIRFPGIIDPATLPPVSQKILAVIHANEALLKTKTGKAEFFRAREGKFNALGDLLALPYEPQDAKAREIFVTEYLYDWKNLLSLSPEEFAKHHPAGEMDNYVEQLASGGIRSYHLANYIAYTSAEAGKNLARAEALAREAVRIAEEEDELCADILDTLGWVVFKRGRPYAALQHLLCALEKESTSDEIFDHVKTVLVVLKMPAEADLLDNLFQTAESQNSDEENPADESVSEN